LQTYLVLIMAESNKKYILYVKTSCPFCEQAEALLSEKEQEYFIVPFDDQPEALDHLKWAYSYKTVPMIFMREDNKIDFIGGYSDLVEHFGE